MHNHNICNREFHSRSHRARMEFAVTAGGGEYDA